MEKWTIDLNRHFTKKEYIQVSYKQKKKVLNFICHQRCKLKPQCNQYHYSFTTMARILEIGSVGGNVTQIKLY